LIWGKVFGTLLIFGILAMVCQIAEAQAPAGSAPAAKEEYTGMTLDTLFNGSVDSSSYDYAWTTTTGYVFDKHFSVDLGIPILFVNGTTSTGTNVMNAGLGNVFGQVQFVEKSPKLNFGTVLTTALPTGDTSKGFSTGRVTYDLTAQIAHEWNRWTPFASAGVANSLFDTRYRQRPYSTLGDLAHFEAGTAFDLGRSLTLSASVYDIAPWGTQKVYSHIVNQNAGNGASASHGRVYQANALTTGSSSIDADHGFNADMDFSPWKYVEFDLAYSHSVHFQLDTVSFGVGFHLTPLLRRSGISKN